MTLDLDLLETLDADPPTDLRIPGELATGECVAGKYTIARVLGRGAMGAVYLAHDERLARDVAIKVGLASGPGALARAEREAQTLAKLSHPNVVVIFEVGEHDGRLFVAMEYLAGGTARAWLAARARSWREIVALYAGAGVGLAAAHAAGIVHRDFKPDNLLVGDDGRPRVADFGLARSPGEPELPAGVASQQPRSDRLTRTGGVVGTPAYMAPEQLVGGPVDELADQFAFCVALWEALHGARPFAGASATEVRDAMRVPPKPTNTAVSRSVTAALTRGLAVDPAARWPSLGALVAELRVDRSRRGVMIGIATAVAAAAVVASVVARGAADPCAAMTNELAASWNPVREVELHAALGGAGGEAAWASTDARLGDFAARWLEADRATCRATHNGGQSPEMHDKRVVCLSRARSQLVAIGDVIAAGGNPAMIAATQAVLPDLAPCADVEALAHEAAPPTSPAERVRVVAVDVAIGWTRAHMLRGEPVPATALERLVVDAHAAGWPPLEARAIWARGLAELANGDHASGRETLEVAASSALAAGDNDLAAHVMIDLARWYLDADGLIDAERWTRLAEDLAHRLNDPPALGTILAGLDADLLERGPRVRDAAPLRTRQAALAMQASRDPVETARARLDGALGELDVDDAAGALRDLAAARAIAVDAFGSDAPELAVHDEALARADAMLGELDVAEQAQRHAVAVIERWSGATDARLVRMLASLGALQQRRGDLAGSLASAQRALAIEQRVEPDREHAAERERDVAIALERLGDLAGAASHANAAISHLAASFDPEQPRPSELYTLVGRADRGLGQLEPSRLALTRAIALADRADRDRVTPRIELSYTLVALHRGGEAVASLTAIAAVAERDDPRLASEYHFALAKSLVASGDRTRAKTELERAKTGYAALGGAFAPQLGEVVALGKQL